MSVETDRELLELAAKAAGLTPASDSDQEWVDDGQGGVTGPFEWKDADGVLLYHWRPLDDDGDRHRLLVSLKMTLAHEPSRGGWCCGAVVDGAFRWLAFDENEAQAVVLAAAAIGRAMP